MKRMFLKIIALMAGPLLAYAPPADITGTWVAKRSTPMGDMETVYEFKVKEGKISGSVSMPSGDQEIVDGKITGEDIEFTTVMDFFGQERRSTTKGKFVGDELHLTPQFPGPGGRRGRAGGPRRPPGPGNCGVK
jgi:hypothetical protein